MTYALILPPELLRDLVLIRKQCKESIRSFALSNLQEAATKTIRGMETCHGKEHVVKLYADVDNSFRG